MYVFLVIILYLSHNALRNTSALDDMFCIDAFRFLIMPTIRLGMLRIFRMALFSLVCHMCHSFFITYYSLCDILRKRKGNYTCTHHFLLVFLCILLGLYLCRILYSFSFLNFFSPILYWFFITKSLSLSIGLPLSQSVHGSMLVEHLLVIEVRVYQSP